MAYKEEILQTTPKNLRFRPPQSIDFGCLQKYGILGMNQEVFETLLSQVCEYKYSTEYGGLVVKKLFKPKTPCYYGGLGKGCHIESRKHKEITTVRQKPHWRHKCTHCGAYVNSRGER